MIIMSFPAVQMSFTSIKTHLLFYHMLFTNKGALLFHVLLRLILVAYNMGTCGVFKNTRRERERERNVRFFTYLQMMKKS